MARITWNARVMQPILNDIAGSVPTWDKVASGMVKMYEAEVLQKFPVIQVRQTVPYIRSGGPPLFAL